MIRLLYLRWVNKTQIEHLRSNPYLMLSLDIPQTLWQLCNANVTVCSKFNLCIVWVRIITPDGINIHTGNAEMTDAMGRSGITGEVDRRYGERYGMSLLVSLVTAATTYSIPVQNTNEQVVVESFGKEQSSLAKAILEEHLDIKPRVTVPAGSRILISASRDVWFKKPQKNHISVVPLEEKS